MAKKTPQIPRPPRRSVSGVLFLDKPVGLTSNAALQTARRLFNAKKAGHTGTLDPLASGLLPLTFGEATKFSQMLLDANKAYVAGVKLGVTTTTGDAEGEVLETRPVNITKASLLSALAAFTGEIEQIPPMYSALKRDGKPLYEYARAGIELERSPRRISIFEITLLNFAPERFDICVKCSKGTYIRSLAIELGEALGCGAHLDALRRTHIGTIDIEQSITLDQLKAIDPARRDQHLAPIDTLVANIPRIELDARAEAQILQGQPVALPGSEQETVRLYGPSGFLGLGVWKNDSLLWAKRLVCRA